MKSYGAPDDFRLFELYADIHLTHDNVEHYRGLAEERLLINRCRKCSTWIYPHRPLCPECLSWNVRAEEVSGLGRVYMFTLIMQLRDPQAMIMEPVVAAAIELVEQEGLRYLSRVVGCDPHAVAHDMPVRLAWIDEDGRRWPAFAPAEGRS